MTIWEIQPPQGFSDELQLTTMGRPSIIRFDTPQGLQKDVTPSFLNVIADLLPLADNSFQFYGEIVILPDYGINPAQTIPNYIMTVDVTLGSGKILNSNGFDVNFYDSSGTILKFKRQLFNVSTGRIVAQILIPSAKVGIVIQILCGKISAIDSSDPNGVYDSTYKGVWELSDATNGGADSIKDSTVNSNDGTPFNMDATNSVNAQVGDGIQMDGVDERIEIADDPTLDIISQIKIKSWFKTGTPLESFAMILCKGAVNTTYLLFMENSGVGKDGKITFRLHEADLAFHQITSTSILDDNIPHQAIGTYDGTDLKIYIDGILEVTLNDPGLVINTNTGKLVIGNCDPFNVVFSWGSGFVDEIELLDSVRSDEAEFIKVQYLNEKDPALFSSFTGLFDKNDDPVEIVDDTIQVVEVA